MPIALANLDWMLLNIFLACLGLLFGLFFLYSKKLILKIFWLSLWILFMPNTIYLVTDLEHMTHQLDLSRSNLDSLAIFFEYISLFVFGVFSYLFGIYPLYQLFPSIRKKSNPLLVPAVLIFNTLIAFGVVLGKVERTHSFYIFTQPQRVLHDVLNVFSAPSVLVVIISFSLLCNIIFLAFHTISKKLLKVQ